MQGRRKRDRAVRPAGLAATAFLAVLLAASATPRVSASLLAGTQITNTARANYKRSGSSFSASSNAIVTIVSNSASVQILPGSRSGSAPPTRPAYLAHEVKNAGNGSDSFALSSSYPASWSVRFLRDDNRDGKHQNGENAQITSTGALQPGGSAYVFAEATVPASAAIGSQVTIAVSARSSTDTSVSTVATDSVTVASQGKIAGRLRSREGLAIAGGTVSVTQNGTRVSSAVTASDGSYSIGSLPLGIYDVAATAPEIVPQQALGKSVTSEQPEVTVDFSAPRLPVLYPGSNLISIPFNFANPDLRSVINMPTGASAAAWSPDASGGRYVYLGKDADFPPVQPGRAYILSQSASSRLPLVQTPGSTSAAGVSLKPGWNLVGWPDLRQVPFSGLGVSVGGQVIPYAEAVRKRIIQGYLWGFDPTARDNVLVHPTFPGARRALEPWTGYWVRAYTECELVQSSARSASAASGQPNIKWTAQLAVACGSVSDRFNYLGVASDAVNGSANPYRLDAPPTASRRALDLFFTPSYAASPTDRYAVDIRPDSAGKMVWDFTVTTTLPNATVAVSWPDIRLVPPGYNLTLVDLETGRRCYMRTSTCYSFTTGTSGAERKFQVAADPAQFARLSISPLSQMPAPSGVTISYTLSQDASVSVEVRTFSGTTVRRLAASKPAAAGTSLITWDGKDQAGRAAANGPYLVMISAATGDGQIVRQSRTVTLVR